MTCRQRPTVPPRSLSRPAAARSASHVLRTVCSGEPFRGFDRYEESVETRSVTTKLARGRSRHRDQGAWLPSWQEWLPGRRAVRAVVLPDQRQTAAICVDDGDRRPRPCRGEEQPPSV